MPSVSNYGILSQATIKEMIRHTWIFNLSFYRSRGLFTYSNLFAFALEIGIMLSAFLAVSKKSLLYGLISLSFLTSLILTTSRAGITILIIGLLITIISISRHKLVIVLGVTIPVLSFLLLNLAGYDSFFSPKIVFEESSENLMKMREDSTEGRMMLYKVTLEQVFEKPFFGWGTYRKYPNNPSWPYLGSHSTFLSFLYRLGIFGAISFVALIWLILKNVVFLLRKNDDRQNRLLCSFLLGILCINAAHMLVLDVHDDIYTLNIMWATWAMAPALRDLYYRKNDIQDAY
jgi:O-antigen ligase